MRIFAPAWGKQLLTGEARASYLATALTCSQALVEGLGGYVLVDDAETLAGGSAASSIQGANLKTVAAASAAMSSVSGDADSLLNCAARPMVPAKCRPTPRWCSRPAAPSWRETGSIWTAARSPARR